MSKTPQQRHKRHDEGGRETGPALEARYRFVNRLVCIVERFPRSRKFLLGDRMQTSALDVLERLVEATYARCREELPKRTN